MPPPNVEGLKAVASNVVSPQGRDISICNYCASDDEKMWSEGETSYATGFTALQLSCDAYQKMLDRGWRRSGTYCYKPELKHSCCPQYTIKLDGVEFKPTKSQRKVVKRWTRFVVDGDGTRPPASPTSISPNEPQFSLVSSIHEPETGWNTGQTSHKFEVTLQPMSYTAEKYALYENYQVNAHQDSHNMPYLFYRFLVESPLLGEPIPYPSPPPPHLPTHYGSYHQLYRLDGRLIAFSVLDILPTSISSVYFMYDKKWANFSLGKLSVLREAALVKEIHDAGVPDMRSVFLGFYVHSNHKMRSKGAYSPSYLLDPEEYSWHPFQDCVGLLNRHRYACFSKPQHSLDGPAGPHEEGIPVIPDDVLDDTRFAQTKEGGEVQVIPVKESDYWMDEMYMRPAMLTVMDSLGMELAKEVVFY